jgi:hypothetical protein
MTIELTLFIFDKVLHINNAIITPIGVGPMTLFVVDSFLLYIV